jgi:hypothetical protein
MNTSARSSLVASSTAGLPTLRGALLLHLAVGRHGTVAELLVETHGVLAPASAWRDLVVPKRALESAAHPTTATPRATLGSGASPAPGAATRSDSSRSTWAELLRRVFALNVLTCPHCGGPRRLIAQLTDSVVVRKILGSPGPAHRAPTVRTGPLRRTARLRLSAAPYPAERAPRPRPKRASRHARAPSARSTARARIGRLASTRLTASASLGEPLDGTDCRGEPPSAVVVDRLRRKSSAWSSYPRVGGVGRRLLLPIPLFFGKQRWIDSLECRA